MNLRSEAMLSFRQVHELQGGSQVRKNEIKDIASLIALAGPLGITLFNKVADHVEMSPAKQVEIAHAIIASGQAGEETIAAANAWML